MDMGDGNMAITTTTEANHGDMMPDIQAVIDQLIGQGWTEAPDCAPGHYPSWDCEAFYQCDHGYRSLDRPCAPGTLYNAAITGCDHANNNDDTENTCKIGDPPLGNLGPNLGINLDRVHY